MKLNFTEQFIFQMALTYANMMVQTNASMTPTQKAAVENAITANSQLLTAFNATGV